MDTYGLVGYPLGHSFSKAYFEQKFQNENIKAEFLNFELENIADFPQLLANNPNLKGLSVTIPHKETIIPFLDEVEGAAQEIGAVNSVRICRQGETIKTIGYNTDYYGFGKSLDVFLERKTDLKALILGTGGASKAISYALKQREIPYKLISRNRAKGDYAYQDLTPHNISSHHLIINTTPLGTFPNNETFPEIPYESITNSHFLFDLVYNPEKTTFLRKGEEQGAKIQNGLPMLHYQAERSWELWHK